MTPIAHLHITRKLILPIIFFLVGSHVLLAQPDTAQAGLWQREANAALAEGDFEAAGKLFSRSKDAYFAAGLVEPAVDAGMGLGVSHLYRGDFEKSSKELLAMRDSTLQLLPGNDSLLADVLYLLGTAFNSLGDNEKALEYSLEAVEANRRCGEKRLEDLAYIFHNLGAIYFERSDYADACEYEIAARKAYRQIGDEQTYAATGINLGLAKLRLGDAQEALRILKESERLADLAALDHNQRAALYLNLGLAYLEVKDWQAAREALNTVLQLPGISSKYAAFAEGNIGFAYLEEGNPEIAIGYLRRAVALMKARQRPIPDDLAKTRLHLGQALRAAGQPQAALETLEMGIRGQLELDSLARIDTLSHYSRPCDLRTLMRLLAERGQTLDRLGRPDEALASYRQAFEAIDRLRQTFLADGSRQFLSGYVMPIYERSLDLCWRLHQEYPEANYLEDALRIVERNKAVLLLEAMKEALARRAGSLPDSLVKAEKTLASDIAFYEKQLYEARKSGDSARIDLHEGYLIRKQAALDRLEARLQREYLFPNLRKNGGHNSADSGILLSALQAFAEAHEAAVLEIFEGKSHTYALLVSGEQPRFHRYANDSTDADMLATYRRALSDWNYIYSTGNEAWKEVQEGGRHYFKKLIHPLFGDKLPARLMVVPDGGLAYLPFEAFLTDDSGEEGNYSGLPYLIRHCEVSYAYSAELLLHPPGGARVQGNVGKALAFAPSYRQENPQDQGPGPAQRDGEADLPGAQMEVNALARHFKVESYTGNAATEGQFKDIAGSHSVLHLAMHGILDDTASNFSYLAFARERIQPGTRREDGALYAYELEQMQLPAQLVVLSACETGTGQLLKGEGVLSLARGFMFAGAKSVAMSLWKLEDRSTAQIMDVFYAGLAAGEGKSEALRHAKLAWLGQADDFSAHPGFWAGLVLIGNTDSLSKAVTPPVWALPLAAMVLIVLGFGLSRFSGRNAS